MKMKDYVRFAHKQLLHNLGEDKSFDDIVNYFHIRPNRCITLVASGSSYNSALMVKDAMQRIIDIPVFLSTPEFVFQHGIYKAYKDFVIVISQSGESTNILECVGKLQAEKIDIVALTGNMDSQLAKLVPNTLDYGPGNEYVDFVTTGVQTLVLYLLRFALRVVDTPVNDPIDDSDLKQIALAQVDIIAETEQFIAANKIELCQAQPTFFIGNGANYGVAKEGALKFQETLKRPAMYYELEEFLHGPDMQLTPNYTVFLLDNNTPSGRMANVAHALRSITNNVYFITSYPGHSHLPNVLCVPHTIDEALSPFVTLPPIQLIAAGLTDLLNKWDTHPFFNDFDKSVAIKANDYQDQLATIKSKWHQEEVNNK